MPDLNRQSSSPRYRLEVDIGGTFTDFCLFDEDGGGLYTLKVLSTPSSPGSEIARGIEELQARYGVAPESIIYFTHGTTVGVNTVIQRNGVELGLLTTPRFEDVLEVARLKMPDPYDLFSRRPVPLVGRERVFSAPGRMLADGTEDVPLDEQGVRHALSEARDSGCEAIVVALLHAYRNPSHERRVREIAADVAPELDITLSSDVWPVIREYERTTTAVVAGYVQPIVRDYLTALEQSLQRVQVPAKPMVTKSNGGVMTAEAAKNDCAQMLLSGTASGVIGASYIARLTESPDSMSLDVGGTSADVALIRQGQPQYGVGELIGDFPVYLPTVAVSSIGEGGGSIAWLDAHGVLKVGPESAGSTPGPACYGRGGTRPTITDAFVVCGMLDIPEFIDEFGYQAVQLDAELARSAVGTIADRLEIDAREAAQAIIDVAVSGMYLEVSKLMSRHGLDPRQLTLQAFGGAGPMMSGFIAEELGMARIVIPPVPGVLSALGGLIANLRSDFIRTVLLTATSTSSDDLRGAFGELTEQAVRWLRTEQGFSGGYELHYSADMRYIGQSFELETRFESQWIEHGDIASMRLAFDAEHERVYGHMDADADAQCVNLRVIIVGDAKTPELSRSPIVEGAPSAAGSVSVFRKGATAPSAVFERERLQAGQMLVGPAIIVQADCTTVVLQGWHARVDTYRNLIISRTLP